MSNQHLIIPPPELVQQWREEPAFSALSPCSVVSLTTTKLQDIATRAAQWGADQELDACCEWVVRDWTDVETADKLRAARRPKAPSTAEEAKADLDRLVGQFPFKGSVEISQRIWQALDRLQELEENND